jgi:hypothetical protein
VALRLWLGFPKSLDISKAIDKNLGAKRAVIGVGKGAGKNPKGFKFDDESQSGGHLKSEYNLTAPATPEAKQWEGWGTALKPANEPILLARKPLSEKTIAENVMKWGTGGLNIDGCRIGTEVRNNPQAGFIRRGRTDEEVFFGTDKNRPEGTVEVTGRFPANVILDEEAARMLDEQSGVTRSGKVKSDKGAYGGVSTTGFLRGITTTQNQHGDSGGASRFFYCAKASRKERGEFNKHPTVKPIALMEYLIKLVTPPEGIVLDPFLGSGTTALAALNLGRFFIGIELNEEYCEIARRRVASHTAHQELKFA